MKENFPVVVQANKLIESRYTLTAGEQKLVLAMVAKIKPDDVDFLLYEMSVKELAEFLNIDRKNVYR